VKLDDQFADHPKLLAVGPLGMALQVAAICYCSRHLTDGFMSRVTVRALVAKIAVPWVSPDGREHSAAVTCGSAGYDATEIDWADLMVEAGLWDEVQGGYKVHDYEHFNPTRVDVLKQRAAWSDRQSRSRSRRDAKETHAGVTGGVTPGVTAVSPSPVPVPVPDPDLRRESAALGPDVPPEPCPTAEPPAKPEVAKPRAKPATRLPDDADLPAWLERWKIPTSDPEVTAWLDYHRARDSRFADWSAAWRTWARRAQAYGPSNGTSQRRPWVRPVQPPAPPRRPPSDDPPLTIEEIDHDRASPF